MSGFMLADNVEREALAACLEKPLVNLPDSVA
jgi:hypothetical protein